MENDLPLSGETASAATSEEVTQEVVVEESNTEAQNAEVEETENNETEEGEGEEKPQKTPEQLEINRLRKATARLTRQREEAKAKLAYVQQQIPQTVSQTDDGETLSLTRAQLAELVNQQAEQLAPTIQKQQTQAEQREAVLQGLLKSVGKEGYDELTGNLEDAFNGFTDNQGNMKPCLDAVFYAEKPQAVMKYLADPDNFEEAESIASMNAIQAGRAIARLEFKLEEASKNAKPKPSNASKPLEAVKGGGTIKGMPDPSDTKAYIAWANQQDRR